MKISVIQPDLIWENKLYNLQKLSDLIYPLSEVADIVVLPEMFNTGFSVLPETLYETPSGETYHWMKKIAEDCDMGLCGSYIVKENEKFYNRFLFVGPKGEKWYYDKRHLFSMGGEDKNFTAGKSRLVFTFRGVKISAYICYDLRFPVWNRNCEGSDLIIYSASWPGVRRSVWNVLLRARAIENQCYVAGSNRTGTDGKGISYFGDSMIIDPLGEIIASAGAKTDSSITAEISTERLSELRKKFPVLRDADNFEIGW